MNNAAYFRAKETKKQAHQVWERINQAPFPRIRCTTSIVKYIRLHLDSERNVLNVDAYTFKVKNLGQGVYEVYMVPKEK